MGFYQVATRVAGVYEVPMPHAAAALLRLFEVLNINISGIGLPLQCLGLHSFFNRLLFFFVAPP